MAIRYFSILALLFACALAAAAPNERETKVRQDKERMDADDFWIYNDLEKGMLAARRDNKPMLVVFRCIP